VPLLVDRAARQRDLLVAFSDRRGGVSSSPYDELNLAASVGDRPRDVARNRAIVARAIGFRCGALVLARQVHGNDVIEVDGDRSGVVGVADGLVGRHRGPILGILTADCAPVLVEGQTGVAVLHAGWRGLVAGIIERGIDAVGGARAAWVGPAVRACCYEVGSEVVEAFAGVGLPVSDERHVDPAAAAAFALERAGARSVAVAGVCTRCDDRYFSYRRARTTGRQGAFIAIT
jgi:YfiH family protein